MSQAPETRRDADLLKVQIYSDHCLAKLTSLVSFVCALFIGCIILFYTLFYEHLFSPVEWEFSVILITSSAFILIYAIGRDYRKEFQNISDMIETIRQGKELPKLEELGKRKKK